ncbi:MAG: 2'-5' RNA ligase family protein [Treponema sp.]|jgi:2'-5' RNA ligase|nr:2'-5' RNA ligase family protein [Treponema sp.]
MRLFIAVNFDEELTGRIVEIQEKLRAAVVRGNFPRRDNLHLTLVFLGETGAGMVPAIRNIIAALPSSGAFTLNFSRAGCFRHSGKELWYIGAAPDSRGMERLLELRTKLAGGLEGLAAAMPPSVSSRAPAGGDGLSFDRRPFNAHITLGRELRPGREFAPFPVQIEASIQRISLMQSEHRDGRLVYTELFGKDL